MAKYFIDFNNYTDISDVLSEWTPRWSSLSTHWAMEVIDGKKCLKNLPGSPTTPGAFSYNLLDGFTGDIELVYKIRANGYNFDGFMETALCGSGSTGSENGIIGYYHAGTGKHQIGEYSNGSNMASSQYSIFGYDNNLWYWVRLRIENNQTFYRTWPDGSQEPSAWDITWTPLDTSIISTALWHGIGTRNAADGSRYCACIGFGINGDTAPITPLDKVLIRFNNYANATEMLSEWTPKWGSTVSDWSLQNVNGEKCLAVQNASSNECFLAYNAINGVNQIEIAYKFMAPVNTSHCINPYLKASEVAKQDAYGVYYDYGTHHKFLYYDGGLVEEGYLYPMVYTPGNWYWTRIKIAGSNPNFYFKTWADGTAEPETWYDSQTYPAIPDCAYNGLGTLNGVNLSYCSVVGFGVNGASAPINEDPVYVDISGNVTGSFSISGYISNSSDNSNGKFKLLPNRNRFNRNTFSENNNISNIINSAFFGIPIIQLSSNISLTTNVNADATVTHSGGNIVNITGGISSNTSINNATLKNLRLITCSISNTTTTNNANILNSRNIGVNIANTTNVNSPILQNITNISCNISSNTTVDGSVKNTNSIGATISTISNLSGILGNVTNKINVNISSSTSISGNVLGSRNISLTIPSTTTVDANIKNVFSRTSIINCNSTVDANISKALNITCGINASSSINANAIIARVISIDGGISSTTVINNVNSIKNSNIISTIPLNCNVNANLNEIVKISSNIDSSSNVTANNKFIRFITSSVTNPSTIDINSKVSRNLISSIDSVSDVHGDFISSGTKNISGSIDSLTNVNVNASKRIDVSSSIASNTSLTANDKFISFITSDISSSSTSSLTAKVLRTTTINIDSSSSVDNASTYRKSQISCNIANNSTSSSQITKLTPITCVSSSVTNCNASINKKSKIDGNIFGMTEYGAELCAIKSLDSIINSIGDLETYANKQSDIDSEIAESMQINGNLSKKRKKDYFHVQVEVNYKETLAEVCCCGCDCEFDCTFADKVSDIKVITDNTNNVEAYINIKNYTIKL